MKLLLIAGFALLISISGIAQYRFAVGVNVGTTGKIKFDKAPNADSVIYELSIKILNQKYLHTVVTGAMGKDYFIGSLMSELHKPVFYPLDFYIGLGIHAGSYNNSHWNDGAAHKKTIGGLNGVVGLQLTVRPVAFSVGTKPFYNLWPDDRFYWMNHAGLSICF